MRISQHGRQNEGNGGKEYLFRIDPGRDSLAGITIELQGFGVTRGDNNFRFAVISLVPNSKSTSSLLFFVV